MNSYKITSYILVISKYNYWSPPDKNQCIFFIIVYITEKLNIAMSVFFPITCSPTVYCPLWWQPWFLLDVCQLICHSHGFGIMSLQRTWCTVTNASVILNCSWWHLACRFSITGVRPAVSAPLYANGREETRAGLSHTMNVIVGSLQRRFIWRCLLFERIVFLTASYWIPLPFCVSLGFGGAFLQGVRPLALFQEQHRSFRVESFTLNNKQPYGSWSRIQCLSTNTEGFLFEVLNLRVR